MPVPAAHDGNRSSNGDVEGAYRRRRATVITPSDLGRRNTPDGKHRVDDTGY